MHGLLGKCYEEPRGARLERYEEPRGARPGCYEEPRGARLDWSVLRVATFVCLFVCLVRVG